MRQIVFTKNIFLSNFKGLNSSYKLTFALTYQCNLKCKICQIWRKKRKEELSTTEIEKFFKTNNFFNWIDLTGGEIFLRTDLIEIVKAILTNCKNLYLLHFPTNGFLTKKIITDTGSILKLNPHKLIVTISLDGPNNLHDELHGTKGSWKRAIETYERLKKLKNKNFEVYLGITLSKYNLNSVDEAVKEVQAFIPGVSYNDFHINIAQTSKHFYKNVGIDLGIDKRVIKEVEKFRGKKKRKFSGTQFLETRYQKLIPKYIKTGKSPLPCRSLSASVFIDPYGNVYPCAIWDKKIGNLKDFDFDLKKIWNLSKVKKIRKKIVNEQCPGCWTPCEAYQTILSNLVQLL